MAEDRRQYGFLHVIDGGRTADGWNPADGPSEREPDGWDADGPAEPDGEPHYEKLSGPRLHEIGRVCYDKRLRPASSRLAASLLAVWIIVDPYLDGFPIQEARRIASEYLKMAPRTFLAALRDLEAHGYIDRPASWFRSARSVSIRWIWNGMDKDMPDGPQVA